MNRAMFSGVAGLKAHQTKMDVIGNNIANVNTYGYKGQRAIFSDIYYQNLRNASAGNANRGGTNPSSVGYGSNLAAIQANMTQSSMQNTGFGLDVAIAGEGFLQVMDPDGNIFYTKAGLLDYDSNGYLTDINGNFVLGSTETDGAPGSQKIKLDNVSSVDAKAPTTVVDINGIQYTVTASNPVAAGNVSLGIRASEDLPAGLKATATISSTGAIEVKLNATEKFDSLSDLNKAINDAIIEANGGKQTAAGTFTITTDKNAFGKDATPGSFTGKAVQQPAQFEITDPTKFFDGKMSISDFTPGTRVTSDGPVQFNTAQVPNSNPPSYTVTAVIDGVTYSNATPFVPSAAAQGAKLELKQTAPTGGSGVINLEVKDPNQLPTAFATAAAATGADIPTATVKKPQSFLGGAVVTAVSSNFQGQGPMQFNVANANADGSFELTVTVGNKTYKVPNGARVTPGSTITLEGDTADDGTMTMTIPALDEMAKNFGLTTPTEITTHLANALENSTSSPDFHNYSGVQAILAVNTPLTGAEIVGANEGVTSGTIDGIEKGVFGGSMTFMKASNDFKGVGATDFNATYTAANGTDKAKWTITMTVDGVNYTADVSEDTTASSILLKGPDGDYVQMKNPTFESLNENYGRLNNNTAPTNGVTMPGLEGGATATATASAPSRNLGLGTVNFTLTGGTEGGAVTLDQLTNIAIGADGTVTVNHPEKGNIVVGKISLANFANSGGLQLEGNNYYSATSNSGNPVLADPGTKGTGSIKNSALEMSNVDLSAEFADMITTQRGFQANSRIITVSDTMLEELINLKR